MRALDFGHAAYSSSANGFPVKLQQNCATCTWSLNGQRRSVTDANGNRAELRYDGFDRLARWVFPSLTTDGVVNEADYESYGYDAAGNRTSLRKRDGSTLSYTYDALNRMTRKTVPDRAGLDPIHTRDIFYGYNVLDLQTYARFDSDTGAGVTNSYDALGRLLTSTTDLFGSRSVSRVRDDAANRIQLTYGGQTYRYDFDDAGRLTDLYEDDGTPALLHRFIYNARGQVELRTEGPSTGSGQAASSVDPAYDRIGRLTSLAHAFAGGGGNVTLGFTLNPASQIDTGTRNNDDYAWNGGVDVSRSYSVNGLNQYTAAGGTTFAYDANGNLTRSGSTNYVYDVENRLVSASGGHTATLRYDPLGRLFEVTGTGTPRRFLWDGDALVAEYTSTGSLGARFVHGTAGIDDPLIWYGGGENRRLHADHQGSIIAVTDGAGAIKWINGYDEWGIPNTPNNTGRFQYTGQLWIGELGMYHYKARIYSPTLGRFLQVDPVGYDDQVNLYAYVGNDPVNATDPTGEARDPSNERPDPCGSRLGVSASCSGEAHIGRGENGRGGQQSRVEGTVFVVLPEPDIPDSLDEVLERLLADHSDNVVSGVLPIAPPARLSVTARLMQRGRPGVVNRTTVTYRPPLRRTQTTVARTIQPERMPREVGGAQGVARIQRELPQPRTTSQRIAEAIRIFLRIINPFE